jgi:double-stranded uracil-DNA glycosylase
MARNRWRTSITLKRSMAPVGSQDAHLLVLGSLPGEASLATQRYYAHPSNQFWRLLGAAIGEDLAALDYQDRLRRLAARDIALWDVVAEARRQGSLDGAIRAATANELADFAAAHPRLEAVAFNGRTAAAIGRRALAAHDRLSFIDLPSSSAALTRPFAVKAAEWAVLGRYAGVAPRPESSKLPA